MHTKHFSFIFPIPDFYMSSVKVIQQVEANIHYSLDHNGKVDVEGVTLKPGIAQYVDNWPRLEAEIKVAAEHNSKQYRRPGDWMSNKVPQSIDPVFQQILKPYAR